jgi:hypothetical protein
MRSNGVPVSANRAGFQATPGGKSPMLWEITFMVRAPLLHLLM